MKLSFPLFFAAFCLFFLDLPIAAQSIQEKTLSFAEIKAEVTIRRDARSIPYIEARNDRDLYFAQGFTTASDRLWQMDLLRRTARGELAEIFGKTVLEEDKRYRLYGFSAWAETAAASCSAEYREVLEAYTKGVNAYLQTMPAEDLPAEFRVLGYQPRPWTVADSLVVSRLFAVALGETWYDDAFRASVSDISLDKLEKMFTSTSPFDVISIGKDKPAAKTVNSHKEPIKVSQNASNAFKEMKKTVQISLTRVGLGSRQLAISNAWAVSGKRTISGKPLLANDPHLFPSLPSIWYLTHLGTPSHRVVGASTPGIPGIIIGRNNEIAWGITNLRADTQDLVLVKFTDESRESYRNSDSVQKIEKTVENIKVRKGFTGNETEEIPVTLSKTKFGPIFYEERNESYALSWSVLNEKSVDSEAFYFVNKAKSYQQWRTALALYKGQPQSFIYADAKNIAYQAAGTIPLREKGDGTLPFASNELKNGFSGTAKFSDLPALLNPQTGIIVSANNRMVGMDYTILLSKMWIPPYRAKRISDLLNRDEKMSAEKFRLIQADTFSNADALFINEVKKASKLSREKKLANEIASVFDGSEPISSENSKQIALSFTMRKIFAERILNSLVGTERAKDADWTAKSAFLDYLLIEKPKEFLPKEFSSYDELLIICYADAVKILEKTAGNDRSLWTWGKLGSYKFYHPLGSVPLVGQQFALDSVPQFAGGSGGTINAGDEVSMRMIADLSNPNSILLSLATGQSGNPKSNHYKDQFNDWKNASLKEVYFSTELIEKNTSRVMRLSGK